VPGDPSSAAFHVAAAVLVPGSRLVVEGMAGNWTRVGFFRILERMGAVIVGDLEERASAAPDHEPLCELDVAHGPLVGTRVTADEVPLAIDELPLVALLGCFAEGETVVEGAQELRVKESDRIATTCAMLRGFGIVCEEQPGGFTVEGRPDRPLDPAHVHADGDHRIAMAAAVAGLVASGPTQIDDADNVATSYPGFAAALSTLGATIRSS
jgi:3-phosphoshikimate 1-carboxyvinyltransferase